MKYVKTLGLVTAAWIALSVTTPSYSQQLAYTSRDVELRAGPAWEYPVVAILLSGVQVSVQGCLSDYQWCDVVAGSYRGWTYAQDIAYPYQGTYVPMLNYGAVIGVGIVAFSVVHYWDQYYRGAPWYSQRQFWIDRPRSTFRPSFVPHQPPPVFGSREIAGPRTPQIRGPEVMQRPSQTQGGSEIMQRPSRTQGSEGGGQRSSHGWGSETGGGGGGGGGRHR
jgi:uncharacterized protein YraI